jgi:hypothetical protein
VAQRIAGLLPPLVEEVVLTRSVTESARVGSDARRNIAAGIL